MVTLTYENLPEGLFLQHHQSGLYGKLARQKPFLSGRHVTACLKFAKSHLQDAQATRNKIHVHKYTGRIMRDVRGHGEHS